MTVFYWTVTLGKVKSINFLSPQTSPRTLFSRFVSNSLGYNRKRFPQSYKSGRAFWVGPVCQNVSGRFRGCIQNYFATTTRASPVTVEAIELIKSSTKRIHCELFSHAYSTMQQIPAFAHILTHSVNLAFRPK